MKRSSVIALGAAGLVAGTAYWSYPNRPAYCDNPVRTAQQDQECTALRNRSSSSSSSHYYGSSGWGSSSSSYGGSSGSSSSVSRGGFGSTGHSMGVSS